MENNFFKEDGLSRCSQRLRQLANRSSFSPLSSPFVVAAAAHVNDTISLYETGRITYSDLNPGSGLLGDDRKTLDGDEHVVNVGRPLTSPPSLVADWTTRNESKGVDWTTRNAIKVAKHSNIVRLQGSKVMEKARRYSNLSEMMTLSDNDVRKRSALIDYEAQRGHKRGILRLMYVVTSKFLSSN